jgi:hypothetical protein
MRNAVEINALVLEFAREPCSMSNITVSLSRTDIRRKETDVGSPLGADRRRFFRHARFFIVLGAVQLPPNRRDLVPVHRLFLKDLQGLF